MKKNVKKIVGESSSCSSTFTNPISAMEYYNYNNEKWEKCKIRDCFVLAICPIAPKNDKGEVNMESCGLNICIVIEDSNQGIRAAKGINRFWEIENKKEKKDRNWTFTSYLLGDNGIKIPVEISGGNLWDKDGYQYYPGENTCCYFGYIHPLMIGSTERGRNYTS